MSQSAVKQNDLDMYEVFADEWWSEGGSRFRSLRAISDFRLKLIDQWIPHSKDLTVLDLGCGGGFLCAPLSKQGSTVIGVDISPASLKAAQTQSDPSARFICADIRSVPLPSGSADIVLLGDVLDHLPDYPEALKEASRLLRPGGLAFVNTINRNPLSRLLAVTIGESIGLIPKGTHDPDLFITPRELSQAAERFGMFPLRWQGERPAIFRTAINWTIHFAATRSLAVAYSALFQKRKMEGCEP